MAAFALILAQAAGQPAASSAPKIFDIIPWILILAAAWFLLIVPMRRQDKQRKELIASVKKNDRVVNSGGIIGVVESVKEAEDEVVLRGGLRITKSSIVKVMSPEASAKE
jgi:preprotein translocase subunit YajC